MSNFDWSVCAVATSFVAFGLEMILMYFAFVPDILWNHGWQIRPHSCDLQTEWTTKSLFFSICYSCLFFKCCDVLCDVAVANKDICPFKSISPYNPVCFLVLHECIWNSRNSARATRFNKKKKRPNFSDRRDVTFHFSHGWALYDASAASLHSSSVCSNSDVLWFRKWGQMKLQSDTKVTV